MSGFCRLRSVHGPGSSDAIGACAPFTVWAVVPLLDGKYNKNPYKNNRDPTCWLGPLKTLDQRPGPSIMVGNIGPTRPASGSGSGRE